MEKAKYPLPRFHAYVDIIDLPARKCTTYHIGTFQDRRDAEYEARRYIETHPQTREGVSYGRISLKQAEISLQMFEDFNRHAKKNGNPLLKNRNLPPEFEEPETA